MQPGDTAIITDQDRVSHTLEDPLTLKRSFERQGIGFKMLGSPYDTTTPEGNLMFQVLGSVAEFQRRSTSVRTKRGVEAARVAGKHIGRRPKLSPEDAQQMWRDGATGARSRSHACTPT